MRFKKHTDKSTPGSIDGFARSKSNKDDFKLNYRRSVNSRGVGSGRLNANDYDSFPGLKSTYQPSGARLEQDIFQPEHKHKRRFKPSLKSFSPLKIAKRLALASVVLLLIAGSWIALKGFLTARKVFNDDGTTATALSRNIDPSQLNSEGDGRVNILILGKGGDTHEGGELTDSMTIASIDPFDKSAGLLSIPRDMYVDVPDFWSMKINAAYSTSKQKALDQGVSSGQAELAGINTLKDTVEEYLGVPIHYHVLLDFIAFEEAVNALGGVEIDVQERLYDTNFLPTILLDIQPGRQKFSGQEALFYIRSRYTSPRGDFDRAERQRELIVALKEKVLSVGTFSNPIRISQLLDVIGDNVQTNISLDEMLQIYGIVQEIDSTRIESLSFVDDPILVQTTFVGDQSVVIPLAGRNDFSEIRSFVRNKLLDGFLKQEGASVAVLNGSGVPGAATRRATELESYGYNVVEIGDAPTADYLSTILYDYSSGENPYTQRYLERRLGAVTSKPQSGVALTTQYADFVIIVGANEEIN